LEKILVTGGAGFIGANLTSRLLSEGHEVVVFDNLSRPGSQANMKWLKSLNAGGRLLLVEADIRDEAALNSAVTGCSRVYHLAGQVAVTTSVQNPREDFEINATGTLNVLEAVRLHGDDPIVLYSSTNKVYGGFEDLDIVLDQTRYTFADHPHGVSESRPLDFHSPYGCSKGAGDQYMLDYARIYGVRSVVMRQSCIYGPQQHGMEDQGWLAWFILAILRGTPITIYGDGCQVRDVLYVNDLLDAYQAAVDNIDAARGQAYNIGGGPDNIISVWTEYGPILEELFSRPIDVTRGDWRPGDQRVYISDIRKANQELGWTPKTAVRDGIGLLFDWLKEQHERYTP
jgi:CDP-paratose 2-epimerase